MVWTDRLAVSALPGTVYVVARAHEPDLALLEQVLGRAVEKVQVWAFDRITGEPFYLPEGQADPLRPFTRERLRCPYPGCDAVISTRGGSKRAHFFHPDGTPHPSDGESEHHLAAKRLIYLWATARVPTGGSAQEEQTVKDPATALHRRADVMVTLPPSGGAAAMVAYEVEYKDFDPRDWRKKQDDYDIKDISCAWLLGHTKLRRYSNAEWADPRLVRVPPLARAWAVAGFVRVIDPVTGVIGTLTRNEAHTERIGGSDWEAFVEFAPLDQCTFHPEYGIFTPTMARILAAEEAERARRRAQEEQAALRRAEQVKRLEEQARADAELKAKRERWAHIPETNLRNWNDSEVKKVVEARWGKELPKWLTAKGSDARWIHAEPAHWHAVLYERLIHPHPDGGTSFAIDDAFRALNEARINANWDYGKRFRALICWLEEVNKVGMVRIERSDRTGQERVDRIVVKRNWDTCLARQDAAAQAEKERRAARAASAATASEVSNANPPYQHQPKAAAQVEVNPIHQARRVAWETSDLYHELRATYGGQIPTYIEWRDPNPLREASMPSDPVRWHAIVYLRLIRALPPGTRLNLDDATAVLAENGITATGDRAAEAISEYLYYLVGRSILRPADPSRRYGDYPTSYVTG